MTRKAGKPSSRFAKHPALEVVRGEGILSQAIQEWMEGATTRPWSPERTVKAHERGAPKQRCHLAAAVGDEIVCAAAMATLQSHRIKSRWDNKAATMPGQTVQLDRYSYWGAPGSKE